MQNKRWDQTIAGLVFESVCVKDAGVLGSCRIWENKDTSDETRCLWADHKELFRRGKQCRERQRRKCVCR